MATYFLMYLDVVSPLNDDPFIISYNGPTVFDEDESIFDRMSLQFLIQTIAS